jgi:hypothetical protein
VQCKRASEQLLLGELTSVSMLETTYAPTTTRTSHWRHDAKVSCHSHKPRQPRSDVCRPQRAHLFSQRRLRDDALLLLGRDLLPRTLFLLCCLNLGQTLAQVPARSSLPVLTPCLRPHGSCPRFFCSDVQGTTGHHFAATQYNTHFHAIHHMAEAPPLFQMRVSLALHRVKVRVAYIWHKPEHCLSLT